MKRELLAVCTAATVLLGSCAKRDDNLNELQAISFKGKINELLATMNTGAAATSWLAGDKIGVFMVDNGTVDITENNSNRAYVFSANQFSPEIGQEVYYPVSNSSVDFIAYYPYQTGSILTTAVSLNVADQNDLQKIDFLYAKSTNAGVGFNKTAGTGVPLIFDHTLSKIVIKPEAGAGLDSSDPIWNTMGITIEGLNTTCDFDLSTGLLSNISKPATIIPFVRTAGIRYEAIVIPEVYATAGAVTFNFQIGSDIFTLKSKANETFEAGKEYTYTVTVNKTGLALDNVTIKDWTSESRLGNAI